MAVALWLLVPIAGCERRSGEHEAIASHGSVSPALQPVRRVQPARLDTVFDTRRTLPDTLFARPRVFTARDGRLFVYDAGDYRVTAIDSLGSLRWQAGGRGSGPGEFANVLDMEVGPDGRLWLFDAVNVRLTVLSRAGRYVFSIPMGVRLSSIVPTPRGVLATPLGQKAFAILIDTAGNVLTSLDSPIPGTIPTDPIARQVFASGMDARRQWAAIFPYGNVLLVYRDDRLFCRGDLVEAEGFATSTGTGESVIWAVSVAILDSAVYVLPKGRSLDALRVVDEYALDCTYRRSFRLPGTFLKMAGQGNVLYLEYENPSPAILALRFHDSVR